MQQRNVGAGREGRAGPRALSAGSQGQSPRQDRSLGGSRLEGPGRAPPSSARVLKPRPGAARAERWPARSRGQGGSALCAACGGKTLERAGGRRERMTEVPDFFSQGNGVELARSGYFGKHEDGK